MTVPILQMWTLTGQLLANGHKADTWHGEMSNTLVHLAAKTWWSELHQVGLLGCGENWLRPLHQTPALGPQFSPGTHT